MTANQPGERLDKSILAQIGDRLSRAQLQTLISEGLVTVDDKTSKPGVKLKGGEQILLRIPLREQAGVGSAREYPAERDLRR